MISKLQMFELATSFKLDEELTIEKRGQNQWCVKYFNDVVNRNLDRQYEPMPSNRTSEFINDTRFTLDEAFDIARKYLEKIKDNIDQSIQLESTNSLKSSLEPLTYLSLGMCECESKYSIEAHGDGYVLYWGRCNHKHGYNLVYLKEPAYNCDIQLLERIINLGNCEYWKSYQTK